MKKNLIAILTACLLLVTLLLPAAAEEPGMGMAAQRQFRAGFVQDGSAYVYLQMGQSPLTDLQLQLKVNETTISQYSSGYLHETDQLVHYLLLVDCSGTVRAYGEQISSFISSLLRETLAGGGTAAVTVAGVGDTFRLLQEDPFTDPEALAEFMGGLAYRDNNTDLYGGILDALTYIQKEPHTAGELYQVILVSDGQQDDGGQLGLSQEQLEQLETCFDQRQDVIFHTYGMGEEWQNQELEQAELGRGCHLAQVDTGPDAAAQSIAAFTNSLYQGVFELDAELLPGQGEQLQIQVTFSDQPGMTSVAGIPQLGESVPAEGQEAGPDGAGESAGTDNPDGETETPPDSQNPDGEEAPPADTGNPDGEAETPADGDDPGTDEQEAQEAPSGDVSSAGEAQDDTQENKTGIGLGIWLLIPVVAVLAALGGWLLRRQVERPRGGGRKGAVAPPPEGAVRMQFHVERGQCVTRNRVHYLVQELLIGRSTDCDLVFEEPEVAERNSRIRMQDGEIYLEDLGSPRGTAIGGMRIHAPNRLRSGDVITIGSAVQIRVEYEKN